MNTQKLFTQEGIKVYVAIKKHGVDDIDTIALLDNALSKSNELLRQYRCIFGSIEPRDWINPINAKTRIVKEFINQAIEDHDTLLNHNL